MSYAYQLIQPQKFQKSSEIIQYGSILFKIYEYSSNQFICFVRYEIDDNYYLCMFDDNICYYLRHDENGIIYYDIGITRIYVNISNDIIIYSNINGYYIIVDLNWVLTFLRYDSMESTYCGYIIRELIPRVIYVSPDDYNQEYSPEQLEETDKQSDISEDDRITSLISEYKTKEDLEKYIKDFFIDSKNIREKLLFNISNINDTTYPTFAWNIFFKDVIVAIGSHYVKKNLNPKFKIDTKSQKLEFFLK